MCAMKQPITVESILEHSDGSATITYDMDSATQAKLIDIGFIHALTQGLRVDDPGPWDSAQLELAFD